MRRKQLTFLLVVLAFAVSASVWAGNKKKDKKATAVPQMEERQRALHALNRLTFGPRPGDVDRVTAMGVDQWIEQQLHPEKIADSALEARLEPLRTLRMDARALVENFPPPQLIKQVAEGRRPMPSDKTERAIYESQVEKYQDRQEKKAAKAEPVNQAGDDQGMMLTEEQKAERREARMYVREQLDRILALPTPDKRMQAILAMDPQQRQMLARALPPEEREQLMNSLTPQQREQLMAMNNPPQVVATELMQGKVLRAAYSERQLDEVMTDFWFNHFNVFIGKGADRYLVGEYERDVIRPHALGKFQDLLMATAKSPAMMFYLDNWQSVGPRSQVGLGGSPRARNNARMRRIRPFGGPFGLPYPRPQQRPQPPQQANAKKQPRGLNENYARELSAVRASGADVSNALPLVQTLNRMGMPLYGAQPPTGYSMKAETWVNSAALLNRMNFALRFTSGRMPGVSFAPERVLGSAESPSDTNAALARLENTLLAGDLSKQTHETILKHAVDPEVTGRVLDDPSRPVNVGVLAGLILGSPEFQKR